MTKRTAQGGIRGGVGAGNPIGQSIVGKSSGHVVYTAFIKLSHCYYYSFIVNIWKSKNFLCWGASSES